MGTLAVSRPQLVTPGGIEENERYALRLMTPPALDANSEYASVSGGRVLPMSEFPPHIDLVPPTETIGLDALYNAALEAASDQKQCTVLLDEESRQIALNGRRYLGVVFGPELVDMYTLIARTLGDSELLANSNRLRETSFVLSARNNPQPVEAVRRVTALCIVRCYDNDLREVADTVSLPDSGMGYPGENAA